MKQITNKLLKILLSVIMCFSVLHIPYIGTEVFAEEGEEPTFAYIRSKLAEYRESMKKKEQEAV